MDLVLYAHPFSSYCQKVMTALYECDTPFSLRLLDFGDAEVVTEFGEIWPLKHMPVLLDAGRPVMESTIIIEHLALNHPGKARLIPEDPREALEVRFMDRVFDNYVMTPMQRIVFDFMRPPGERDAVTTDQARARLTTAYRWLDQRLGGSEWATGGDFTMADCAAAPALFYADWVHPIAGELAGLRAYRSRLLARPSFARAVELARPYRKLFPPGAPDRD